MSEFIAEKCKAVANFQAAVRHPLVNRTSPKGQPFLGTCAACGMTGITFERLSKDECPNQRQMTNEDAILEALNSQKIKAVP